MVIVHSYVSLPEGNWLVVLTILKKVSSSMGRMTSHILWKIKNVPNHQPDNYSENVGNMTLCEIIMNGIRFFGYAIMGH
jgi:hypothetical protein